MSSRVGVGLKNLKKKGRRYFCLFYFLEGKSLSDRAKALVKWLWVTTHVRKVVGSNPGTVYWMDIFHIDL